MSPHDSRRPWMLCLAITLAAMNVYAQYRWSGAGGDDSWGTAGNWTNLAPLPTPYNGLIWFGNDDAGNVSVLDQNRTINGLFFTNNFATNTAAPGHTLDLNGYTLALAGGELRVGYNATNSKAAIRNGTLDLGAGGFVSNLIVGFQSGTTRPMTGSWLSVTGTLAATQLGNLMVAREIGGNAYGTEALLDLTAASITGPLGADRLSLEGSLYVAYSSGDCAGPTGTVGILRLPSALTEIRAGSNFVLGAFRDALGTIDAGAGSGLTSVTARGTTFLLCSDSGTGRFTNWPSTGVSWTVGSPGAPAFMRLGHFQHVGSQGRHTISGMFSIAEASFTAWLGTLCVGKQEGGNSGNVNFEFDLQTARVAIGGEPDRASLGILEIGTKGPAIAGGGAPVVGLVTLPPEVTNLTAGVINIGSCNNARGRLDIGSNAQLKSLIVTQALYFGGQAAIGYDDAGTFVDYLPTGMVVQVGTPDQAADAFIGCRNPGQHANYAETYPAATARFVISNGLFTGYFSNLSVGVKEDSPKTAFGVLDLRDSQVSAFRVSADLWLGSTKGSNWSGGPESQNSNGRGYLYLPETQASVCSNLWVGDTATNSLGWLELFGTRMTVSNRVEVGPTGTILAHVRNSWTGLDIVASDPAAFVIAPGGQVRVAFENTEIGAVGLRMGGDQRSYLRSLVDGGLLTWSVPSGRPPEIWFDGTHTVVRRTADGTILQIR